MKQQVLKALANPARIFYVPYSLAVINFAVQFIIYIIIALAVATVTKGRDFPNPLFFIGSLCAVHMILAFFSKKDLQLGQIISAQIQLIKQRIPRRLAA